MRQIILDLKIYLKNNQIKKFIKKKLFRFKNKILKMIKLYFNKIMMMMIIIIIIYHHYFLAFNNNKTFLILIVISLNKIRLIIQTLNSK